MARPESDPDRLLPLTWLSYLILLSLADGPCHGYGIIKEVEERTSGKARIEAGTLYAAIKRLVVRQGRLLVAVGIVAGEIAALALSGTLRSMVFGIEPTDPVTYALVALAFLATGLAACWLPARRATRVEPIEALTGG